MYALCPRAVGHTYRAVGHTYQAEPSYPCYNYYIYMPYFAWEDQSDATYCIVHTVLISCITVLYESRSVTSQKVMEGLVSPHKIIHGCKRKANDPMVG